MSSPRQHRNSAILNHSPNSPGSGRSLTISGIGSPMTMRAGRPLRVTPQDFRSRHCSPRNVRARISMAAEAYMARSRRPIRPCSAWESVRSEGQTNVSTVALSTGRPRIYDLEEVVRFARDSALEGCR